MPEQISECPECGCDEERVVMFRCRICGSSYEDEDVAQKCEAQGIPSLKRPWMLGTRAKPKDTELNCVVRAMVVGPHPDHDSKRREYPPHVWLFALYSSDPEVELEEEYVEADIVPVMSMPGEPKGKAAPAADAEGKS